MMAIFSIYMGLIYNEFFSMPMRIFGGTRFGMAGVVLKKLPKQFASAGELCDPLVDVGVVDARRVEIFRAIEHAIGDVRLYCCSAAGLLTERGMG